MLSAATAGPAFADGHHGHHGHLDVTDTLSDVGHAAFWIGDGVHDGSEEVVEEGWDDGSDGVGWAWDHAEDFCPMVDIRLERVFPDEIWLVGIPVGLCTLDNLGLSWLP